MTDTSLSVADHDLLIRMDERVRLADLSARASASEQQKTLSEISIRLDGKADKTDIQSVRKDIESLGTRVEKLESTNIKVQTEKDTVIKLGTGSIELWKLLAGAVIFLITVASVVSSFIQSFK